MKRTQYFARKDKLGIWRIKAGVPQYFSTNDRIGWCRSMYSAKDLMKGGEGWVSGIFPIQRDFARKICPTAFRR